LIISFHTSLTPQAGSDPQYSYAEDGRDAELPLHGKPQRPNSPERDNENAHVQNKIDNPLDDNGGRDIDAVSRQQRVPRLFSGNALEGEGEDGSGVVGAADKDQDVDGPES